MNYFRATVLGFACILLMNVAADLAQSPGKSTVSDTVRLTVTVTGDDKMPTAGLPQGVFAISDETGVREVRSFSNEDVPLSMAILFDLSGSVRGTEGQDKDKVKVIAEALSNLIKKSNPLNEYFIIAFAKTTYVLAEGTRDIDTVLSALHKFTSAEAHGNTALYDACRFGLGKVKQGTYTKQVILLISDGTDNESRMTLKDLRSLLQEETILIYGLNTYTGKTSSDLFSDESIGARVLEELTSFTGGITYRPDNVAEIEPSLERIAFELRQQYSIGVDSAKHTSSRKWHSLKVKVISPSNGRSNTQKLTVRTRRGYYSRPNAKP
jgi:Ca-activated chloride channel family protein